MLTKTETAKPKVVNGLNVDDLFALIEGVKADAAKGNTHWRVRSAWQGQARSRAFVDGFTIGGQQVPRQFSFDIDEPFELGGSNRFANPQEHLLAALNACMTVGYVAQCAELRSKSSRLKRRATLICAAFSESIQPCRRVTKP